MSEHCLFCGGRIVAATGACEHCGEVRNAASEKRVGAQCPRCKRARLVQVPLGPVALQTCPRCRGSFLAASEWDNLLETFERQPLPPEVEVPEPTDDTRATPYRSGAKAADEPIDVKLEEPVSCPTCGAAMTRFEFALSSKITVDVCRAHGIWLDQGELPGVVASARVNPPMPDAPDAPAPLLRRLGAITKQVVQSFRWS